VSFVALNSKNIVDKNVASKVVKKNEGDILRSIQLSVSIRDNETKANKGSSFFALLIFHDLPYSLAVAIAVAALFR
jgi:hypothetical protein